jgi:holo-[acyl-carrier protein] synthase
LHARPASTLQRGKSLIVGVGTDLVEVVRIEASLQRFGDAFLRRVFTPGEIAFCTARKNAAESLAARFAAKEAGAKALGTGISRGVGWKDLEVHRLPGQAPRLLLHGRAAELALQLGIGRTSLSLTHTRSLAQAFVIAETG